MTCLEKDAVLQECTNSCSNVISRVNAAGNSTAKHSVSRAHCDSDPHVLLFWAVSASGHVFNPLCFVGQGWRSKETLTSDIPALELVSGGLVIGFAMFALQGRSEEGCPYCTCSLYAPLLLLVRLCASCDWSMVRR